MYSVKDLFEEKAASWAQKYESPGPLAERRDRIAEALSSRIRPPAKVLDFGCGTGDVAVRLQALGYGAVGADISPSMLSIAGKRDQRIDWHQITAEAPLPFADKEFDAAVASSVLEYVEDLGKVLGELHRIIRVEGLLLVTVPDLRHPVRWMEWLAREVVLRAPPGLLNANRRIGSFANYLRLSRNRFGIERWSRLLSDHGFQLIPGGSEAIRALSLLVLRRV